MERIYEIAGLRLRVIAAAERLCPEDQILGRFLVSGGYDHTLEFVVVDRLDLPEGDLVYQDPGKRVFRVGKRQLRYEGAVAESLDAAYLRLDRMDDRSVVQVIGSAIPSGITSTLIQTAMEAEHLIVRSDGFLLHASLVEHRGKGILFTAPSGTGKSTQAELWRTHRGARVLNGDRAAVRGAAVWSTPFCGSSQIAEKGTVPVAAIVYLSQAAEDRLTRLSGSAAFRRVWEGCCVNTWDEQDLERCADAVSRTVSVVPVYHLACRPEVSAVELLEKEVGI